MAGRILVVRGGAIGDFILTLPALAALRTRFPQAHLEVLGYPHIAQLALAGGLADAITPIEARATAGFFARGGVLDPTLADYFKSFALIVSYLFDPDEIFQTNVGLCSKAQFIRGPHRPPTDSTLHAAEVFLKPLERLAIFGAETTPRLRMRKQAKESSPSSALVPGAWFAAHPGSGSETKNWPEPHWEDLLRAVLERTGLNLLLVGGEAEGERLSRLRNALPSDRVRLARNVPLAELALLLEQCEYFVGHDSGISHLAAAVGVRGHILWGETSIQIWGPRAAEMRILESRGGLSNLTTETVASAVLEALGEVRPRRRA